ncbi:hypothetical protein SDC9_205378 [bioreactor metagenome]|uniref:Uncharacterized protein n=1 Tax=bioreactor metagenome TaxID=1076179 RepID=A0A645JBC9_9ZZZZ
MLVMLLLVVVIVVLMIVVGFLMIVIVLIGIVVVLLVLHALDDLLRLHAVSQKLHQVQYNHVRIDTLLQRVGHPCVRLAAHIDKQVAA